MFGNKQNEVNNALGGSLIGPDMRITGKVTSDGAVICAGKVDGDIECMSLHVLPSAILNGDIKAQNVIIDGSVIGNIDADTVQMAAHADFNGKLCCVGIAVDEGAKIEATFTKGQVVNG